MQFLLAMAMQFQEIIALPSHIQISLCNVSCAGNTISSEKLQKYWKLFIFVRDGNTIIFENCIAIAA